MCAISCWYVHVGSSLYAIVKGPLKSAHAAPVNGFTKMVNAQFVWFSSLAFSFRRRVFVIAFAELYWGSNCMSASLTKVYDLSFEPTDERVRGLASLMKLVVKESCALVWRFDDLSCQKLSAFWIRDLCELISF